MKLQPTRKTTIPIDVDNGGFIKKGTKILVLKKYMPEAKKLYEEFRSLTQNKPGDDYDDDMWSNDDDTQVNSNIKGYTEQLNAMFESDEFPELDSTEPETNGRAPGIAAADDSVSKASGDTSVYSRRKQEKKNTRKSKGRQPQKGQSKTSKTTRAAQGGSVSSSNSQKSWSDVVSEKQRAVTTLDPQQHSRNVKNDQGDKDMDELKDMIQILLTNSEIARQEANAQAWQVQRWSKTCRSLASQVSELQKVVETLSQVSSCSGSTMSSVTASLEQVRQSQKDCPLPMEVILDQQLGGNPPTAKSLEGNIPEKGDGRDREADREMNPVQGANLASKEITPDKPEDESFNDMNAPKSTVEEDGGAESTADGTTIDSQDTEMENADTEGNDDGFCTPTRKHQASAASVVKAANAMEGEVETNNSYAALMPLSTTRIRGSSPAKSPSGSSPRKKKPKVNSKFMKQMEEQLDKQQSEEAAATDDDIAVSLLG
jgi:hypothetical protein